jgi:hypothetical protein
VIPESELATEIQQLNLMDPFARIPDSIRTYGSDSHRVTRRERKVDDRFRGNSTENIMKCLRHLRARRDPNSRNWSDGLPVFFCGGGANVKLYRDALSEASRRAVSAWQNVAPLDVKSLPLPEMANDDLQEQIFQRLAVAYGLSFDRFEIGEIVPPGDIPDIGPPPTRDPIDPVGKEQV